MFIFGFIRGAILGVSLGLVSGLIAKKICKKKNEESKNDTDKKFLYVISGNLRKQGKSDGIINKLVEEDDMV